MSLPPRSGSRGYWLVFIVALAVVLPVLGFGFFIDDYLHFATIQGRNDMASPFDLYVFGTGDVARTQGLIETGPVPWFLSPEFRVHFFRPFACLLMVADHRLFGFSSVAYHAHSILWRLLLCFAVLLIFRRTLPPATGLAALFIFVVDESHLLPTAWWSNRHAVMAVGFGLLGVAAHLRWREDKWRPGLPLSLVAYGAALLSGESGLGALAYVLAYELFGARDAWPRRFRCVLPASLVALGYFVLYRLGGYGAQFSDIYLDPGVEPLAYLAAAPGRFLMHMGAQFFMAPCELSLMFPALAPVFMGIGLCVLVVVGLALKWLWPRMDAMERRALRWLMPGAVMALLPSLAAIVNARVLLAASLGGSVVIAVLVVHGWRATRDLYGGVSRPLRALAWTFIMMHLVLAPLSWPVQVALMRAGMNHLDGLIRNSELDESRVADSQVVLFNCPDPYTGLYPLMLRHYDGRPLPRSWWTLSLAPCTHRITRTGAREMELELVNGQMFTTVMEGLFRSARQPLRPGEAFDLGGLCVTVLDVGARGPTRLGLAFEDAPESDQYQLLVFQDRAFRRFVPPEMGHSVEIAHEYP